MPRVLRVPKCLSAQVPFECPSARVSNCLNVHLPNCLECPSALVPRVPKCLSARVPLECPLSANFLLSALRMKKRNELANSFIEFLKTFQNRCGAKPATLLKLTLFHGCFFTFFKLYKWYQIAQRTTPTFTWHLLFSPNSHSQLWKNSFWQKKIWKVRHDVR